MNFANTNNIPFSLFYIKIKLKFSGKRLAFKSNYLNENREKTRVQNTKPRNIYAFTLTFFLRHKCIYWNSQNKKHEEKQFFK